MSRQWKSLPTHLPGWHPYTRPDNRPKLKGRKARRSRANWIRKKKIKGRRFEQNPPARRPIPADPKTTLPVVERVLLIYDQTDCPVPVTFRRTNNLWRAVSAPPQYEWMTRILHPNVIHDWLNTRRFPFQWLKATPVGTDKKPTEDRPAEDHQPPATASAPQGENTAPSKNNPPPVAECGPGFLAQNGLANPRCLIPGGVPGTPQTESIRP